LILSYQGGSVIKPNDTIPLSLHFNIGTKTNYIFIDIENINIKGKIKISINNDTENKYIYIPLNISLKIKPLLNQTYLSSLTTNNAFKLNP